MYYILQISFYGIIFGAALTYGNLDECNKVLNQPSSYNLTDDFKIGDVVHTFEYNFTNGTFVRQNCDDFLINGNKIILNKNLSDCKIAALLCNLRCTGGLNNLLSFTLQRVEQRDLKFPNNNVPIPESTAVGNVIYNFNDRGGAMRDDCVNHDAPFVYDLMSNGSGTFGIGTSGHIVLRQPLDYEKKTSYTLQVLAKENVLNNGRNVTAQLKIIIEDVDDMDPEFDHQIYRLFIPEENSSIVGTDVPTTPRINATDRDLGAGKQNILYKFQNETKISQYFNLNKTTGLISVLKVLDREDPNQQFGSVIIKAVQENTDTRSATATLIIDVTDVNDNLPKFNPKTYKAALVEHSSAGSYVTTVTATDNDEGENAVVLYNLTTYNNIFEIDNRTGVIRVLDSLLLDREANYTVDDKLMLTVDAVDLKNGSVGDTGTVDVTLYDMNDHNPVFSQSVYTFIITNSANGSFVGQVSAKDKDSGPNGNVSYNVTDPRVTVTSTSGNISLAEPLLKSIEFSVQACDQSKLGLDSRRCSQAWVSILLHVNTSVEDSQHGDVMENVQNSTSFMTIQVSSDASMIFEMGENVNAFSIDKNSGVISTREYLDREQKSNYTFPVYIFTSDMKLLANITVTVDVLDANDNGPVFTDSEYVFPLPTAVNQDIGSVQATDVDLGNNSIISYSIQNSLDSYYFEINDTTGHIRLKHLIPEGRDPLQFAAMATDHGKPQLSSVAQIYVTSTTVDHNSVKIKTPLTVSELEKQKNDLQKDIGNILNMLVSTTTQAISKSLSESLLVITAKYKNDTAVLGEELLKQILLHMSQIKALFSHQSSAKNVAAPPKSITAPEIALIVVAAVMLLGSIVAVVVLFRKWDKQKRYIQLHEHMKRRSSLYESQELKLKIEDETSDYNGSLNTQEDDGENTANGDVMRGHTVNAFVSDAYDDTELKTSLQDNECSGESVIQSSRSTEAINEAIASLDNLTEELNAEDNHLGESNDHQPFDEIKPDYSPYENVVTNQEILQENTDSTSRGNIDPITGLTVPEVPADKKTDNPEEEEDEEEEEPQPDYNVKGVRFSAQVLDTVENKFEPLKNEKGGENESQGIDTKENTDDSDDKDGEFVNDKHGDETDRVDEEIRSPLPTIRSEDNFGNAEDIGTFHFGISNEDEEESTQF